MYFSEGNPVLAFGKTQPIKRIISVDDYYSEFAIWYLNTFNEYTDISKATFGKRLSSLLNIKSVPHSIEGNFDTFYEASNFNLEQFRLQYKTYLDSLEDSSTAMSLLQYVKFLDKQDNM